MSVAPSDLVFFAGGECLARYGTLVKRTSPAEDVPETATRSGSGLHVPRGGGEILTAGTDVPRVTHLDLEADAEFDDPALLLERQITNYLFDSNDFAASGTSWADLGPWTVSTVTGAISAQTGYQHTNPGGTASRSRRQDLSTLSTDPESFSVLVENVDATMTSVGIYDTTAGGFVVRADFTWSTAAVAVGDSTHGSSASARAEHLGTGPNGGALYRITATATPDSAGNSRRLIIYPTGTGTNTETAILHHAELDRVAYPSSPIITTAGAGATRPADSFYAGWPFPPQEMTAYLKFVEAGTVASAVQAATPRAVMHLGASGGTADPRLVVYHIGNASGYRAVHDNSSAEVTSTASAQPAHGDLVELRVALGADGSVRLHQTLNEGSEVSAAQSAANTLGAAWSAGRIYLGSQGGGSAGVLKLLAAKVALGSYSLDEMRAAA